MATTPKEKKKGVKKASSLEVGDSGTRILDGVVNEEYNTSLKDVAGIKVYDEMRRSDGTVRATALAVTLPIRRAKWTIQPADETPEAEEQAEFVRKALFDWQTVTWNDFLREALLMLPFGVMAFEKVFEMRTEDGKDYITWRKFASRLPRSIYKWETTAGELGIQQRKNGGDLVDIPMSKLIVFVNEKEGENWWGTSIFRSAYKHWFMKNQFYRIDAIAFERQGLGVPYIKLPEGANAADRVKGVEILQNLRANHQAYIIEPHDYEIGFKDMMAQTLRDPKESIAHHNREIVKGVLAHFLELGSTDSGSRALSTDQSDLFLQSLEAVAGSVCDVMNKYAIEELINLNFDGVKDFPKLTFSEITRTNASNLATALSTLINAGSIKNGENDEAYLRGVLGLPERDYSEDDKEEAQAKTEKIQPVDESALEEIGIDKKKVNDIKKKIYPERKELTDAITKSILQLSVTGATDKIKKIISLINSREVDTHQSFFSTLRAELNRELAQVRRKAFAEEAPDFKGFRALTFAEKKVDLKGLQRELDRLEDQFEGKTKELLYEAKKDYIAQLNKALAKNDTQAVKDAGMTVHKKYAKILKDHMKEAYEYGKNNASTEMGVKSPANSKELLNQIDIQSSAIADQHLAIIEAEAKNKIVEAMNKGESAIAALGVADKALDDMIESVIRNTSRIAMAGYINHGRDTAFDANYKNIYALQRSEILDSSTCNYCLSVDNRIVTKDDPFAKNTIFHSGCRGIWVEIMLDEKELPPIGGIPDSIRDRFGDSVNDLIQPKTPQTKQDSDARKEIERRQKRQKELSDQVGNCGCVSRH